jgi:hypothetical protein
MLLPLRWDHSAVYDHLKSINHPIKTLIKFIDLVLVLFAVNEPFQLVFEFLAPLQGLHVFPDELDRPRWPRIQHKLSQFRQDFYTDLTKSEIRSRRPAGVLFRSGTTSLIMNRISMVRCARA